MKIHPRTLASCRYVHKKASSIVQNLSFHYHKELQSEIENTAELEKRYSERKRRFLVNLSTVKELLDFYQRQNVYFTRLKKMYESVSHDSGREEQDSTRTSNYFSNREFERFDRQFQRIRTFILGLCYSMPNRLHADTPTGNEDRVILSTPVKCDHGKDHVQVGENLSVLRIVDNTRYYLMGEAAVFELALQNYVTESLVKIGFMPFRNPDTCHEFILKGAYVSDTECEGLEIKDDLYALVGGASLPAFLAYKVSGSSNVKFMPERFFSCGRRYIPCGPNIQNGLYSVIQRTNVHAFVATSSGQELESEFASFLSFLTTLYETLDLDFRVCYKKSSDLNLSETLRTSVELYSCRTKTYLEAARLTMYDDFVSSRLRILWHGRETIYRHAFLLDAVIVSVPTILAHLLERSSDKLLVPPCLSPYFFE